MSESMGSAEEYPCIDELRNNYVDNMSLADLLNLIEIQRPDIKARAKQILIDIINKGDNGEEYGVNMRLKRDTFIRSVYDNNG